MREPMTDRDRVLLVILTILYAVALILIAAAIYTHITRPDDAHTWTTGIIQESPLPIVRVYAGYTIEVWE